MLEKESRNDYLMWIGGRYYTIQSFIQEARTQGVCRRIPFIPQIEYGKTRIFLIHDIDEKDSCVEIKRVYHYHDIREIKKLRTFRIKKKCSPTPKVFGYFIPRGILVVGRHFELEGILEELFKRGYLFILPEEEVYSLPSRGCGYLKSGAKYLVDSATLKTVSKYLRDSFIGVVGEKEDFYLIDPPIPAPLKRFRGLMKVNGDAILARRPVEEWWIK